MIYHSEDAAFSRGLIQMNGLEEYEELGNAVVLRAVDDWRDAIRTLRKHPDHVQAERMRRDCERFFLSRWFGFWTDLDGRWLLRKLKEDAYVQG